MPAASSVDQSPHSSATRFPLITPSPLRSVLARPRLLPQRIMPDRARTSRAGAQPRARHRKICRSPAHRRGPARQHVPQQLAQPDDSRSRLTVPPDLLFLPLPLPPEDPASSDTPRSSSRSRSRSTCTRSFCESPRPRHDVVFLPVSPNLRQVLVNHPSQLLRDPPRIPFVTIVHHPYHRRPVGRSPSVRQIPLHARCPSCSSPVHAPAQTSPGSPPPP